MDLLLHFDDERDAAQRLAREAGLASACIERHRFPDDELRLRLPVDGGGGLPLGVVLFRSLVRPNEKLVELLFAARTARALGVRHLTLVAPYLAYMRQDIAFHPGEVISQRVLGEFLAGLFDAVITVDPHLHRVASLAEAVPTRHAGALSAAPLLADLIAARCARSPWSRWKAACARGCIWWARSAMWLGGSGASIFSGRGRAGMWRGSRRGRAGSDKEKGAHAQVRGRRRRQPKSL